MGSSLILGTGVYYSLYSISKSKNVTETFLQFLLLLSFLLSSFFLLMAHAFEKYKLFAQP